VAEEINMRVAKAFLLDAFLINMPYKNLAEIFSEHNNTKERISKDFDGSKTESEDIRVDFDTRESKNDAIIIEIDGEAET